MKPLKKPKYKIDKVKIFVKPEEGFDPQQLYLERLKDKIRKKH